jgi:uncharacterized membrane protein YgcG
MIGIRSCLLLCGFLPMLSGCAAWERRHACEYDIPPGALPAPLGTTSRQIQADQIGRAGLDDFVIYNHEWFHAGDHLGPAGRRHLETLKQRVSESGVKIVIEPQAELTGEDQFRELNETRRQLVVDALAQAGIANSDSLVVIGYPDAEGLDGNLAPLAYRRQFQMGSSGSGGGGGGGMGGGGLGGGFGGGMGSGGGTGGGVF